MRYKHHRGSDPLRDEGLQRRAGAAIAGAPALLDTSIDQFRRLQREGGTALPPPVFLPQARDLTIPGRGGDIRLRVLSPGREATGVYLHIHGGGWTVGAADLQDVSLRALVEATGMHAVSVDYRLAPAPAACR